MDTWHLKSDSQRQLLSFYSGDLYELFYSTAPIAYLFPRKGDIKIFNNLQSHKYLNKKFLKCSLLFSK